MKITKIAPLFMLILFVFTVQGQAMKPDPKNVDPVIVKVFKNILDRAPSTQSYDGAGKLNEKAKFKQLIMEAEGKNEEQLRRALDHKLREMIDILTNRNEYRQKIQPMAWSLSYWQRFVTKCQKDFELKYNPNPSPAMNRLAERANNKKMGTDMQAVQNQIMKVYKEGKYYRQYISQLVDEVIQSSINQASYDKMLNTIFMQLLDRKPVTRAGAQSEKGRFLKTLKSAGTDRGLLEAKINEIVQTITNRSEYREKAGYANWSMEYWTKFIQFCAKTFEGRNVGPDSNWAKNIISKKNRYKTIENAQNDVIQAFRNSDRYKNWVKKVAHY